MRRYILLPVILIMTTTCTRVGNIEIAPNPDNLIVAAYVWPSCHDDPVAREWFWGEGKGEWEVINQGTPRFPGHYQPKQPLWGCEPDNDPEVVERWIRTALKYGVNTFIYDWYWYNGGPFLESALNDGFLKAPSNGKMNFCVMWANHNVKRNYWNCHKYGDDESLAFTGVVDWDNYRKVVDRIICQYFTRPNYLKFDGCPVISVFSMKLFIESFGNMKEARKAIDYFREEARKAGFPDIYFMANSGGAGGLSDSKAARRLAYVDSLGVNSFAFYNMGGFDQDYLRHGAKAVENIKRWDEAIDVPVFPCVSIAWDDTPRFPAKGQENVTCYNSSPQVFATFLQTAKEYAMAHPEQPRLITINAWNEWVEGSYLLPDRKHGFGYLEAVRDVVTGKYDK